MPSAKYSCSGSPLIFWNGRTAIDGLSGSASCGLVRRCVGRPWPDPEHPDLRRDASSYLGFAQIVHLQHPSCQRRPREHGKKYRSRPVSASGSRRAYDDAVAEQVVAFRHHLALVHADAQTQAIGLGSLGGVLDRDSATQCLDRAGEGPPRSRRQWPRTAARRASWASGSMRSVRSARTRARVPGSIRADHGGIADDIGRQDASQTAVRFAHPQNSVARSLRRRECSDKRRSAGRWGLKWPRIRRTPVERGFLKGVGIAQSVASTHRVPRFTDLEEQRRARWPQREGR